MLCGNDTETLFHALIECEHARGFWRAASDYFALKLPRLHPVTWARDMLDTQIMKKKDAAVAISVMWCIWGSRNSYNHGEVKYQPMKSMDLVDEFVKTLEIPSQLVPTQVKEIQLWSRPRAGWRKMNCDGALNAAGAMAGAGVVARDENGSFVVAECRRYDHIIDPEIAEVLACRDALVLAQSRGWNHIEVETDCQTVVGMWKNEKTQKSACHQVLQEMKAIVSNFQGFTFSFVRREANKAAHTCARTALSLVNHATVYEVTPGFLIDVVQSDRLSSMK
jgi:ribonuclease HI